MCRIFLVIEGLNNSYPSRQHARLHILQEDPSKLRLKNPFTCSPIFSIGEDLNNFFFTSKQMTITYVMVPNPFPIFGNLLTEFNKDEINQLWFSLGLANLIIIEHGHDRSFTGRVISFLKERNSITAKETWVISEGIITNTIQNFSIENFDGLEEYIDTPIPEQFPLYLKFAFSEFSMSVSKLLSASKKFTPHYHKQHLHAINASKKVMINDLCFLFGDDSIDPSPVIFQVLKAMDKNEAKNRISDINFARQIEAIINDYHGRIIQFNSSLSYVYSQAYSGTFPLFDNHGIIKRHSLLGIGSAIGSLYELLLKLETAFSYIPFEDFNNTAFSQFIPSQYLNKIKNPTIYSPLIFENDPVVNLNNNKSIPVKGSPENNNFFIRFAFYSGRLGFREYDYSATAATQVLVESHSLKWSIINYTHEIIHNHVRTILAKNLLLEPSSSQKGEYLKNLNADFTRLQNINFEHPENYTYAEYFKFILLQFSINSLYMGSLTFPNDQELELELMIDYVYPNIEQLYNVIKDSYKDINEIFVHVLDFTYVYRRNKRIYLTSIWSSWSTIPSVVIDVEQYFLRTLIIIAIDLPGKPSERFEKSKVMFLEILSYIGIGNIGTTLFEKLNELSRALSESGMLGRFTNCVILADVVYNFFTAKVELFIRENDNKVISPETLHFDEGMSDSLYDIDVDEFIDQPVLSKISFLLDQIYRQCGANKILESDGKIERTSSWLLLALSSVNN